jgi:phospholipid/cholesterol/gamma-HCH transport system ATP-binding protein
MPVEAPQPSGPGPGRPLEIRAEGVHKAFEGHAVLRGVDLDVPRGDMVAIVGGSGCGKTVFLQHVIRHLLPDKGRVLVADHDEPDAPLVDIGALSEIEMDRIRAHQAVVFQRNALFSGSVYDNVALWLREVLGLEEDAIRQRVGEALDAVGFAGDPTVLEKHRDDLSGGMAKRVAVARGVAMRPALMIYDEPTTGLDPANAWQIHQLIARMHDALSSGGTTATTLIITHDKDLLQRLEPRVVMLHDGRVHFDGSYEDFRRSDSPVVRPYFDSMPVLHRRKLAV